MFKLDLEMAEEPEIKLPTSAGSSEKQGNSRKTSTSALLMEKYIPILPLEKAMATHSSTLAWRIPGTEEPSGLPSMESYRVGHD